MVGRRTSVAAVAVAVAVAGCSHAAVGKNGLLVKPYPAPTIAGTTLQGRHLSVSSFRGHEVVLSFYASWCAPCAEDAPYLAAFARSHPDVQLVGVLYGDSAPNGVSFDRQYGIAYPVLQDKDGQLLAEFRRLSPGDVPQTFVLDASGVVRAYFPGPVQANGSFAAAVQVAATTT